MSEQSISSDAIQHLALLIGLDVPAGDLDFLQTVFANQTASSRALLPLELDDLEPIVTFDPRWR
jgi:hypothetical protein